jgi:hypothetical protein
MVCQQVTLHVGVPKTGTTTIQSFLGVNEERLRRRGILYIAPDSLESYPNNRRFFETDRLRRGLREIVQRAKDGRANHVFWSHEWLSACDFVRDIERPKLIRSEIPASRYRVIVYLRRQDHRLASGYLQAAVKCKEYPGRVRTFDTWLQCVLGNDFGRLFEGNLDYARLIQPWVDVFGRESVVVRVFERGQLLGDDLLRDFCDAADLPAGDLDSGTSDRNVSFNMELHDMLGMYNSVFEEAMFSLKMNRFIETLGQDKFFSRKFFSRFTISPTRRIEILQRCEESNRKIAKEMLGREDGVLFREPWPSLDEPYEPYSGLTTEKLVPILLHILQKQDDKIEELRREVLAIPRILPGVIIKGIRGSLGKLKRRALSLATSRTPPPPRHKDASQSEFASVWDELD